MEYNGDSQIKALKLQSLRRNFEKLFMKEGEMIGDYSRRVMALVSQNKTYRETVTDQTVIEKILRSLMPKFDFVVPSITTTKVIKTCNIKKAKDAVLYINRTFRE
ncbi:uncharacterized protein LOC143621046 [Bidens hawaiensis]|uniref:uncharacterized protein LOC143621046 n=1 Tax=Bidens hawaiensis TaxID=980011 RepID=UPI00404B02A4